MTQDRTEIRRRLREIRRSITPEVSAELSLAACKRLESAISAFSSPRVALYSPVDGELDPLPVAHLVYRLGGTTFLPKMDESSLSLSFVEFDEQSTFTNSSLKTREPEGLGLDADQMHVIVVPGVSFDRSGNRIGFGQGWYDRSLKDLSSPPLTIGFCFDEQITDRIDAQSWDESVQMIVTPSVTIICTD